MDNGNGFGLADATAQRRSAVAENIVDQAWRVLRPMCLELVISFLAKTLCPKTSFAFEMALLAILQARKRFRQNARNEE